MKIVAAITLACAIASFALGGTAPVGRLFLSLGLPKLAASFFQDPEWKGIAYFHAGEMDSAAFAFKEARNSYNLGNALTHRGDYAAALEAFDLAILNGNADARANFDIVASFYAGLGINADSLALFNERESGPTAESSIAKGTARAAGTGDEVTNTDTMLGLAKLESRGRQTVRRVFNDKFMVADDRWLEQLSDVPGEYLKERIKHEHKQRAKLGLTPPDPEDPR